MNPVQSTKYSKIIVFALILLIQAVPAFSQAGMSFKEFEKKLEGYYDADMIGDISKQVPQTGDFSIWGWDVGDFSGDGFSDLAFSVKIMSEKSKTSKVFMFVDIDGFLTKTGEFEYQYFELPLEIGVSIKDNACYVTKKLRQFEWLIYGYRFDNGSLVLLSQYSTTRQNDLTLEFLTNYQTLQNTEKYMLTNTGVIKHTADYLTLPSYSRGRLIYKGFSNWAYSGKTDYVNHGAFYWTGPEDASFRVKSSYDDKYLYFTIRVYDDVVVPQNCDTCPGDHFEIWFDTNRKDRLARITNAKSLDMLDLNDSIMSGIYCLKVYPGNFYDKEPVVKEISSTNDLNPKQKDAIRNIRTVSSLEHDGFELKVKIPLDLIDTNTISSNGEHPVKIGFDLVYFDIDNQFRPEEVTVIATSVFDESNPYSYGELLIMPNEQWYGYSVNIYKDDVVKALNGDGF